MTSLFNADIKIMSTAKLKRKTKSTRHFRGKAAIEGQENAQKCATATELK